MQNISKHYREIRLRLFYSLYAFICTFITCYLYQIELLYFLTRPFLQLNHTLISTNVTETLSSILSLCFFLTLLSLIPFLVYEWWSFRNPSKYSWETYTSSLSLLLSFFFCELVFIYSIIFPRISKFFSSFQLTVLTENTSKTLIEISPRLDSIIEYSTQVFFLFFLFFQIPLIFAILFQLKICNSMQLSQWRRPFLLFFVCLSALISPPDVGNQVFSTFFCFIMYEFCIWIGYMFHQTDLYKSKN